MSYLRPKYQIHNKKMPEVMVLGKSIKKYIISPMTLPAKRFDETQVTRGAGKLEVASNDDEGCSGEVS